MEKKGQTTIFIILGILVVALILAVVVFREDISRSAGEQKEKSIAIERQDIIKLQENIDSCIKSTVEDAVYVTGMQGGYFVIPEKYETLSGITAAYAYKSGKVLLPSEDRISRELAAYIALFIDQCLPEGYPGLELKADLPVTSVEMADNKMMFNINYNVVARTKSGEYKLKKEYDISIPVHMKKILESAQGIVDAFRKSGEIVSEQFVGKGVDIELQLLPDANFMWTITDPESTIGGEPFHFVFITKK